jgi:signal transduction histidine kinase
MRWLGLRLRIAVAVVASVVAACWALTVTTTRWAATNHEEQLAARVSDAAGRYASWVVLSVEKDPTARLSQDFDPEWDRSDISAEGAVIPIESPAAGIRPELADQFSFVNATDPLLERMPQCLAPPLASEQLGMEYAPGSSFIWSESCAGFVFGYALVRAPEGAEVPHWLVISALNPAEEDDPVPGLLTTLVTYSAVISLIALGVAGILAAMVAAPLARARTMAEAVATEDLSVRIPVSGRDEVARMSAAVNTMADRLTSKISELERANEVQRRFTSDVAHELRTPVAALLASAEALEHPETQVAAAAQVAPQLRRLAGLTEDLLEISRMDAGRAEVVASPVDVVDLAAEVVTDARADGISVTGAESLVVPVDAARLRVILRNLVANARQHGRPPVEVAVEERAAGVRIGVHDSGPGVPEELRERVFDRFVRGDEARHGTSSGLGLAIAAENARLLGATLRLDADGATFVLDLPTPTHAELSGSQPTMTG